MRVAYLLNTYPITSATFIRREIAELEASGIEVHRFAMRRWREPLVDPRDGAEAERTTYLLDRPANLILTAITEAVSNPRGFWRALRTWRMLLSADLRAVIRSVAYLFEATRFKREAQRRGLRHVHAHFATNATTVAMLARDLGGPTFSFTAHGPEEFEEAGRSHLRLKIARAAFVAAISEYARGQLATNVSPGHWDKLHVVRSGLDLSEFTVHDESADVGHDIVCVGRLTPRKGQILLPRAAARALRGHDKLTLTLIGDGETRGEIEREIADLGLGGRVILAGWKGGADVRSALEKSRALVLPTLAEGLPVVILEAMASGRPVIATKVAGIPEILDETCGWPVAAGDLAALSSALLAVAEADAATLRAKGLAGRRRMEARHDIRKCVAKLRNLFARQL